MKNFFRNILHGVGIVVSAYIYALAINYLYVPNTIITGGVTGAAMLISSLLNIPLGTLIILMNIPIFILGYKFLGKRFIIMSILFVGASSLFIDLTSHVRTEVNDLLLAAVYGGLITGSTIGIAFRFGGSSAGVDIIAAILNRKFAFSIGEVILFINSLIILASAFVYKVELALYTLIAIFVASKATDIAQIGLMGKKTIFIISEKSEEISYILLQELNRGATFLTGEGAYTHQSRKILMIVITRLEISQLKEIVFRVDPTAFLTISDTKEVVGKGFTTT